MVAGKQVLTNLQYIHRVADLEGGSPNAPLIGFRRHGGGNQTFNFQPDNDTQALISIPLKDRDLWVTSANPSPGDLIRGAEGNGSLYTVHQRPNSIVKLSIKSKDGTTNLFWTLESDVPQTKITLKPENGSANQLWALSPPA
ncbi:hypothetical protein H1R20_g13370, partial [Candolleomyces eurysporus]